MINTNGFLVVFLAAIVVFCIIHMTCLTTPPESYVSPNAALKVLDEMNENVKKFNMSASDVNYQVANALNTVQGRVKDVKAATSADINELRNSYLELEGNMNRWKARNVTVDDLVSHYPTKTQMYDALAHQNATIRGDFPSKRYVDTEFAPRSLLEDSLKTYKTITDDLGQSITGLRSKQNDMENVLVRDYATRDWTEKQYAKTMDIDGIRNVQQSMADAYARKSDVQIHKNELNSQYNELKQNVNNIPSEVASKYVSKSEVPKLQAQFITRADHEVLSRTVNDSMFALNRAMLQAMEILPESAVRTKLEIMDANHNNLANTVSDIKRDTTGISKDLIDRKEMILGRFRMSGIEPGDAIRVYDRDKNMLKGIQVQNLIAQNDVRANTMHIENEVRLGQNSSQRVGITGHADVLLTNGNVYLNDPNAQHEIKGSLNVSQLSVDKMIVGQHVLNSEFLSELQKKVDSLNERVLGLESIAHTPEPIPVVTVNDRINRQGENVTVRYTTEELSHDWIDRVSSVTVDPGVRATLFSEPGFAGESLVLSNYKSEDQTYNMVNYVIDQEDNSTWDKQVRSIRIEKL